MLLESFQPIPDAESLPLYRMVLKLACVILFLEKPAHINLFHSTWLGHGPASIIQFGWDAADLLVTLFSARERRRSLRGASPSTELMPRP